MSKRMTEGETRYSADIDGDDRNYGWPVSFDESDGYVGISQPTEGRGIERVLLSPNQVRALLKFVGKRSTGRARQDTDNGNND